LEGTGVPPASELRVDYFPEVIGLARTWMMPGPAGCDFLFDLPREEKAWVERQTELVFLLVSRQAYTAAETHYRWAGLMLHQGSNGYARVGVFLGPDCKGGGDFDLAGWNKLTVKPAHIQQGQN